jgi:hypothetical protein
VGARSLGLLQQFVADALLSDVTVPSRSDLVVRANELLGASALGMEPASRLEVYREQYWLRHHANLREDFPTVAWLLGEISFQTLATGYLQANPPRTWNLQRLGAHLRGYLASAACSRDPLVLDACSLDWAFVDVFDAADAGPLDLQALAGASEDAWTAARVELHPALRILDLGHPVHELREAIKTGRPAERPAPAATRLAVWRDQANFLHASQLDPAAFELLERLATGQPLGRACEAVASGRGDADGDTLGGQVGGWFQQWTARGWVTSVRLGS